MRGTRPFLFCDLKTEKGLAEVIGWLEHGYLFTR
jgi:Ni2+-binding GTPase involved in maturation of urease and hydrogenase